MMKLLYIWKCDFTLINISGFLSCLGLLLETDGYSDNNSCPRRHRSADRVFFFFFMVSDRSASHIFWYKSMFSLHNLSPGASKTMTNASTKSAPIVSSNFICHVGHPCCKKLLCPVHEAARESTMQHHGSLRSYWIVFQSHFFTSFCCFAISLASHLATSDAVSKSTSFPRRDPHASRIVPVGSLKNVPLRWFFKFRNLLITFICIFCWQIFYNWIGSHC